MPEKTGCGARMPGRVGVKKRAVASEKNRWQNMSLNKISNRMFARAAMAGRQQFKREEPRRRRPRAGEPARPMGDSAMVLILSTAFNVGSRSE